MRWINLQDGDALNADFVKELRVQENEGSCMEDNSDSSLLVAVTERLHEDVAHIIHCGSEEECRTIMASLIKETSHDCRT